MERNATSLRSEGHTSGSTWRSEGRTSGSTWRSEGRTSGSTWSSEGHTAGSTWSSEGHTAASTWSSEGHTAASTWRSEGHTAASTWSSEGHKAASTWKCADPNCNKVNYGEDESCFKCNLSRDKSKLHQQKQQIFREFSAKKPTDRTNFNRIAGPVVHSISADDVGVSKSIGSNMSKYTLKEAKPSIGRGKCIGNKSRGRDVNNPAQSINHRLSSIIDKYSSDMVSRGERKNKMDGAKYVMQVSLKREIHNLTEALDKVMRKVESNIGAENRKKFVNSLGEDLGQTLKAVDWTRLAQVYDEASALGSYHCGRSKMTDEDVLQTLTSDYDKCNKVDRRAAKFKKYLNKMVDTLENIKNGICNTSVPDVEESIRKLEECLEYPVPNMYEEMVLWSKFKIEEILNNVWMAWNVLQSDCEVKMKLKQMENPLAMFGSKYCCYDGIQIKSENATKDHESLWTSSVGKNVDDVKLEIPPKLEVFAKSPLDEKQDLKLLEDRDETPVQSAIVISSKPDLTKWSITDLKKNTSTPNSTILVDDFEDTIKSEDEARGFYDSSSEECIARNDFDSPKEEIARDEFESPKEEKHRFSDANPIKNTEAGYIKVEELKKLIETYTNQHTSPEVDAFLNNLDRDQDGWVLFAEFEAGLTPALLGCD